MKITIEMLSKYEAPCKDGIEWFNAQKSHELTDLVENAIKEGMGKMRYCNWGIARCMTKIQAVRYACYAARQILYIYEDESPNDYRPRRAIEAAESYAKNPTEENRNAAYTAADAAYAAYTADATYATKSAADAANAAADAAYYAAHATNSAKAACYASNTASFTPTGSNPKRLMAKILRYGVKLLMEGK